ncbi:hypothetical protein VN97_g4430 [Penicillium thymicola]|uniref:Uncharacterized protein n=1 Tax=Penicillium thymicola TaxID=293382 RepID=A0AAI9X9C7_PENTH|nr:hypothetical protein VN97_g4430 [Penicillium thymicola]
MASWIGFWIYKILLLIVYEYLKGNVKVVMVVEYYISTHSDAGGSSMQMSKFNFLEQIMGFLMNLSIIKPQVKHK